MKTHNKPLSCNFVYIFWRWTQQCCVLICVWRQLIWNVLAVEIYCVFLSISNLFQNIDCSVSQFSIYSQFHYVWSFSLNGVAYYPIIGTCLLSFRNICTLALIRLISLSVLGLFIQNQLFSFWLPLSLPKTF